MEIIKNFFAMGGYGFYVWSSYGSVLAVMALQWYLAREQNYE